MATFFLFLFRFFRLLMSGHQAVALENAALRLQLAAFQRKRKRPVLTHPGSSILDHVAALAARLARYVSLRPADTVTRWQRERFRRFWARLCHPHRRQRGRPATPLQIRQLIERMVTANPLWRAPRIHGELKMLGIAISERTVCRILRRLPRPPSQTWKTFLHNHLNQMVSVDFFSVPTVPLKVLFVFIVLEHGRRQMPHFNVTEHPTAAWTAQQIVAAFEDRDAARYLLRDRDRIYSKDVRRRIAALGSKEVLTAPRSPWQNPYAERLIGSLRRECLNHFVILNAKHLKRILRNYCRYYHESRTHLGLDKQCPIPRQVVSSGKIIEIP